MVEILYKFLLPVINAMREIPIPFAQSKESSDAIKEMLEKNMAAAEKMVADKTEQVGGLFAMVVIPIVLIIGAFLIKTVYGWYTGAADKAIAGVKSASKSVKIGTAKLKAMMAKKADAEEEEEEEYEEEEEELPPEKKEPVRKKMLFGVILTKFVMPSLTEADIKEAMAIQENSNPRKKLGEVLEESGKISKSVIAQVLKIQQKQAKTA